MTQPIVVAGDGDGDQAPAQRPAAAGASLVRVAGPGELPGEGPHAVAAGGVDLVLVRTRSGPRLFQGRCPHQGALLGEGELEGGALVCRNHRWRFDVESGRRDGGPECLTACPVVERDGALYVDVTPLLPAASRPVTARRKLADLPGPKGLPLVGNAFQLDLPRLHQVFEAWAVEHGPIYRFSLGRKRSVVISDPDLAEQVLRSRPETFRRVSNIKEVFVELGLDGVFSAEGAAWRPQRRLSMEALAHRNLRGFYPTLRAVAERLQRRWRAAADAGQPVDIVEDLKRFTVDVTTALTFGHDMNTLEQTGDDLIQRRLELLFPAFNRRIFALVPTWRYLRSPGDRRLDRALAEVRTWIEGLVRDARARLAEATAGGAEAPRPSNFLEAMLAARDENGQPFSDDTIFANLMTMLLAGEDTTAYTLAWCVHHMCDAPHAVGVLRAELDAAGGAGGSIPADIEAATALGYAGAVANEAMRLRPVAPVIGFSTITATTIGDVELDPDVGIVVLTRPPVRDARNFAAPDDFRPERWLAAAPMAPHEPAVHIPFGSGPRICPGRSLALLEMKVALAMIYGSFDVTRRGAGDGVREHFSFTMSPTGLTVDLARRGQAAGGVTGSSSTTA